MERFQPDGWLEGLLRPLLMMDPQGWIYFEGLAPDWRFAFFALFLLLPLALRRRAAPLGVLPAQLAWGLWLTMLLWTFVAGNGRYFLAGLVLAGPLVVCAWRTMAGSAALRHAALAGAVLLQAAVVATSANADHWGLARWTSGHGIDIEDSPLRRQPAVFVTSTAISYAILVPRFHPQSRWTNVVGQYDITPGTPEYPALLRLLQEPLPLYAVWPLPEQPGDTSVQPDARLREAMAEHLQPLGLALLPEPCHALRSTLAPGGSQAAAGSVATSSGQAPTMRGFWFCPLRFSDVLRQQAAAGPTLPADVQQAFAAVEQRCPRFFPAGAGKERRGTEFPAMRYYSTDMRLVVDAQGVVLMRYRRALNYTALGPVQQVLAGQFELPCEKPPGRYQPPWARD